MYTNGVKVVGKIHPGLQRVTCRKVPKTFPLEPHIVWAWKAVCATCQENLFVLAKETRRYDVRFSRSRRGETARHAYTHSTIINMRCCFRILADYHNVFVFIIWLVVLQLCDVMRNAVEKVNFKKRATLARLIDSVSHVRITCGQPDLINYTGADYWWEILSYDCYGLPSTCTVMVLL